MTYEKKNRREGADELSKEKELIDLEDAWEEQFEAFIEGQHVDCNAFENLYWETYRFVFSQESVGEVRKLSDYSFVVPMAKILGINQYSNIGVLRTEVYERFIAALLNKIFSNARHDLLIVEVYIGDEISYKFSSIDEFKNAIREVADIIFEEMGPETACTYAENGNCQSECCDGCEKYWEV